MERNDEPRLAVLIDADNTAAKWADAIFREIATLGEASVRRIYGDFSGPHLRSWEKKLAGLAVIPHQQFSYTKGKNSSDIALVIDAMDLMHTGRFDGFVLVSSDSDFTRLAGRLREQGLQVFGIGRTNTPEAWRLFRIRNKRHYSGRRIIPDSSCESADHELFGPLFPE